MEEVEKQVAARGMSMPQFGEFSVSGLMAKDLIAFGGPILWRDPLFHYACPQFRGDRGNEIMSTTTTLKVSQREGTGRSASRRLRKAEQIPAIIYGKHSDPVAISVDNKDFIKMLRSIEGRKTIIELERDGSDKALSFLQEVQRDPITDRFLHADFQEIHADEKFEVEVPIVTKGSSVGVRMHNGILEIASHSVRVRCLAKDLPGAIEVNIAELDVEDTVKVSGLPALEGVEYRDHPDQAVIAILAGEAEEAKPGDEEAAAK